MIEATMETRDIVNVSSICDDLFPHPVWLGRKVSEKYLSEQPYSIVRERIAIILTMMKAQADRTKKEFEFEFYNFDKKPKLIRLKASIERDEKNKLRLVIV